MSQTRPLHPAPGRPAPRMHSKSERIHEHGRCCTRSRPPNAQTHLEVQGHLARRLPVAEHHQHVIAQHRVRRRRQKSLKLHLHACLLLNMRRGGAALASTHAAFVYMQVWRRYDVRACPRAAEVEPATPCARPNVCREAARWVCIRASLLPSRNNPAGYLPRCGWGTGKFGQDEEPTPPQPTPTPRSSRKGTHLHFLLDRGLGLTAELGRKRNLAPRVAHDLCNFRKLNRDGQGLD